MTVPGARKLSLSKTSRTKLWKAAQWGAIGIGAAQIGAVAAVHAIDRVRQARIPGGVKGFPAAEPSDTRVGDDEIRLYSEGRSLYEDQLAAINSAEESIYFETYVWRSDEIGRMFKDALIAAAGRGVQVFIFYDGFGSLNANPFFKRFPKNPNLHVHRLREIRKGIFFADARRTGRTHRKLLVVDSKLGFVGGFNIGIDFGTEWRDTHIRITGPSVGLLIAGFRRFWNSYRGKNQPELPEWPDVRWTSQITAAFNLPSDLLFPVRGQYIDTFSKARDTLYITTAYFIPDREIMRELVSAAQRGVDVKVLIPEYSNHILADWVASPLLGPLLEAGVEIWLYKHAMIHAKTVTADNFRSIVGTANIDRLSMIGNYEITVQIDSEDFAAEMQRVFSNDLTTARQLSLEEWKQRGIGTRILEKLLAPFFLVV